MNLWWPNLALGQRHQTTDGLMLYQREILSPVSQIWATGHNYFGPTIDSNVRPTDVQRLSQRWTTVGPTFIFVTERFDNVIFKGGPTLPSHGSAKITSCQPLLPTLVHQRCAISGVMNKYGYWSCWHFFSLLTDLNNFSSS